MLDAMQPQVHEHPIKRLERLLPLQLVDRGHSGQAAQHCYRRPERLLQLSAGKGLRELLGAQCLQTVRVNPQ